MNVAFLCLGGNIGPRPVYLRKSKAAIADLCGPIVSESSIYETEAWGSDSKHKYLNQVICIHTKQRADELLETLLHIEQSLGRVRTGERNSDRTADLDILFFNRLCVQRKHLEIPHPRLHLRRFVLEPLSEIAPGLVHPLLGKRIQTLKKHLKDETRVKKWRS